MYDPVLNTVRAAGPLKLDELFADLERQRWIGKQLEPPVEVDVPQTKYGLITELDRLGREGLIRCGPSGWEPLYLPTRPKPPSQKSLF